MKGSDVWVYTERHNKAEHGARLGAVFDTNLNRVFDLVRGLSTAFFNLSQRKGRRLPIYIVVWTRRVKKIELAVFFGFMISSP